MCFIAPVNKSGSYQSSKCLFLHSSKKEHQRSSASIQQDQQPGSSGLAQGHNSFQAPHHDVVHRDLNEISFLKVTILIYGLARIMLIQPCEQKRTTAPDSVQLPKALEAAVPLGP